MPASDTLASVPTIANVAGNCVAPNLLITLTVNAVEEIFGSLTLPSIGSNNESNIFDISAASHNDGKSQWLAHSSVRSSADTAACLIPWPWGASFQISSVDLFRCAHPARSGLAAGDTERLAMDRQLLPSDSGIIVTAARARTRATTIIARMTVTIAIAVVVTKLVSVVEITIVVPDAATIALAVAVAAVAITIAVAVEGPPQSATVRRPLQWPCRLEPRSSLAFQDGRRAMDDEQAEEAPARVPIVVPGRRRGGSTCYVCSD